MRQRLCPTVRRAAQTGDAGLSVLEPDTGSGGYTHKFFRVAKSADTCASNATPSLSGHA